MSRASENLVSDSLIDRLVDGELDETERQRLLALLEIEPGGWRRCALAFLEAQAWTRACSSNAAAIMVDHQEVTAHPREGHGESAPDPRLRRPPASPRLRSKGILAASVLLAFASGWFASAASRASGSAASPRQAIPLAEVRQATRPAPLIAEANLQPASQRHPGPSRPPAVPTATENNSWERNAPLVLKEQVLRRLERQGFRVKQRSGLISMELKDGQTLGVPVDEVELRYVGNRIY